MKKMLSTFGAFLAWMFTGVAAAQTSTATTTATTTPGVPNTGAGDIVMNALILAVSAAIALAGAAYLYTMRTRVR
jgi:hypothetical protein